MREACSRKFALSINVIAINAVEELQRHGQRGENYSGHVTWISTGSVYERSVLASDGLGMTAWKVGWSIFRSSFDYFPDNLLEICRHRPWIFFLQRVLKIVRFV